MAQHNVTGAYGEHFIAAMLSDAGTVTPGGPADLVFAGLPIEVKTARPSTVNARGGQGFQFCLYRQGKTDYRKARIVILLALDYDGQPMAAWVIPTDRLAARHKICIPYTLAGKWAYWLDRFEIIAEYAEVA